jgi:hypothetical protein
MKKKAHSVFKLVTITIAATLPVIFAPTAAQAAPDQSWTVVATGLTNPRHIRFGTDGLLYVAEAGIGGALPGTCDWEGNLFSEAGPYMGGYSGRRSR